MRAVLLALLLAGCGASQHPPVSSASLGTVDRTSIESDPTWASALASAKADPDASRALLTVPPGATVRVFFGAWCGDSRREVSRFFAALDAASGKPPFAIEYIAVDRDKKAPNGLTDGAGVKYVPTFVVLREGKELGRIVESAPNGIEKDLGALLRGERAGVISGRHDL
jgi:hypothetical protein